MTHAELAKKQTAILEELAPQIAGNLDPQTAKITQLDLLFMFGGYIPSGDDMYRNAPPVLNGLIKQQCDRFLDLEPHMSYELIVDVNAEEYDRTGNIRVFADGEDGQHERDFYLGHHLAEPFARHAAYQLQGLAESPGQYDAQATLESAAANLKEFNKHMGQYGKLPRGSFAYFRQYLAGYADGTRNASGAFMPSVQLLELAILPPSDMYEVYLDESKPYFPQWSRSVITEWHEESARGINVEERVGSGELALDAAAAAELVTVVDTFINFRMAHLGITKAQIPEAFSRLDKLTRRHIGEQEGEEQILDPNYKGTAGFDVRNVLTNSVYRLIQLRNRLTGSFGLDAPDAQSVSA
jgi:hypothetical protein